MLRRYDGTISLSNTCQAYIRAMIDKVPGFKVLVLDSDTIGIVAAVASQYQILEKDVYLVERIDAPQCKTMLHMTAICFLRPTPGNFLHLVSEISNPRFGSYHLFFSNKVAENQLHRIALADKKECVQQCQEFLVDTCALGSELFSLEQASTARLLQANQTQWRPLEDSQFKRTVSGLFSAVLCSSMGPVIGIRHLRGSAICQRVGQRLQDQLTSEPDLLRALQPRSSAVSEGTLVFLFDRRHDPITPLLHQWTYQAMVHELLGLHNSRVKLRTADSKSPDGQSEVVLNPAEDTFFAEHQFSNFGDLCEAVKDYVTEYQRLTQASSASKLSTIEEIRAFVEHYPEYKRLSGNVSKHVSLAHELSRLVSLNNLYEISALQQLLVTSAPTAASEHLKAVLDMFNANNKVSKVESLKLALLYALRNPTDKTGMTQLKQALVKSGIEEPQIASMDTLLSYADQMPWEQSFMPKQGFLSKAKSAVQQRLVNSNVYSQHRSVLFYATEALLKGRLTQTEAPYLVLPSQERKPSQIIVFVLGGATYEEARDLNTLAKQNGIRIVLGGNAFHHSKSFLADVSVLAMQRRQQDLCDDEESRTIAADLAALNNR